MVSLADARRVIAAAEKKSQEIGQPMNIAVADEKATNVGTVPAVYAVLKWNSPGMLKKKAATAGARPR